MKFTPGFRINIVDVVFIVAGIVGSCIAWTYERYLGYILFLPVVQFFIFCNVFRIRRIPELIWTFVYLPLALIGYFAGIAPVAIWITMLVVGGLLIAYEIRNPGYHGFGWKLLNPRLEEWWKNRECD
jgi:hypothetical protein